VGSGVPVELEEGSVRAGVGCACDKGHEEYDVAEEGSGVYLSVQRGGEWGQEVERWNKGARLRCE
jgi:hypothetical protein